MTDYDFINKIKGKKNTYLIPNLIRIKKAYNTNILNQFLKISNLKIKYTNQIYAH